MLADTGLLDERAPTTDWRWGDQFNSVSQGSASTRMCSTLTGDRWLRRLAPRRQSIAATTCSLRDWRQRLPAASPGPSLWLRIASVDRLSVETPLPPEISEDALSATLDWARQRLNTDLDLDHVAVRACMSRRTFMRRFRAAPGTTRDGVAQCGARGIRPALAGKALRCPWSVSRMPPGLGLRTSPSAYRRELAER